MSLSVPPFQPRQPCFCAPLSSNQRKSARRHFIFPNYHPALPIDNAHCARFRLRRHDLKIRNSQLTQIRALRQNIELITDTLGQIAELQQLFARVAEVHQITVSYGTCSQDFSVERLPSSVHLTFPHHSSVSPKLSSRNIFFHQRHISSSDHDGNVFLELVSRPVSPLSECSALSTQTSPQSHLSSPLLELIGLPPLPVPPPPETDTFHCVSMAQFRKNAWNSDRTPEVGTIVNPFKKRRPSRRKRKHHRRKH